MDRLHCLYGNLMTNVTNVTTEFVHRVSAIPVHGLGLSVDAYSPNLFELVEALRGRGLEFGYLEVFQAAMPALEAIRKRLPIVRLAYHGEGLWLTQPALETAYPFEAELKTAMKQAQVLESVWINHEGASKQIAGYSFGTYLPPLFTPASAQLMAENISLVQRNLDRLSQAAGQSSPFFLVETPPLTYFRFGSMSVAEYFRLVTNLAPCGLVLDIGHLWTVYRYSGAWRSQSLTQFLGEFLEVFPVKRVVEIHIAGLASHESEDGQMGAGATGGEKGAAGSLPPWWIDAHEAPIPALLFDMLEQVLAHPELVHLKGMALEVDAKPIGEIVHEFGQFCKRFGRWRFGDRVEENVLSGREPLRLETPPQATSLASLPGQYTHYARVVTGQAVAGCLFGELDQEALKRYSQRYLPHEILEWGGSLEAMFPDTCRHLKEAGVSLSGFVSFWFQEPNQTSQPYDFFLIKLERFQAFIRKVLPHATGTAAREAADLRDTYQRVNEQVG